MRHFKGFDYNKAKTDLEFIKKEQPKLLSKIENGDMSEFTINGMIAIVDRQRQILMSNPLLDMDKIVVTRFELGKEARRATANKMCMPMANYIGLIDVPPAGHNAQISQLSSLRSKELKESVIFKPLKGEGIADVHMHWNADKMLFASAYDVVYDAFYNQSYPVWRIFEIGVDGQNLKLISDMPEPDIEYGDPCYLPDGRILFTNNIGYNGIPCEHGERIIMNLAIHDPATKKTRKLTFDQDGNWSPSVLSNGRIMYTRYEYTDLTHYFTRIVMHSNPDGTDCRSLYGSNSFWPTSIYDMKELPDNSGKFISVVSGHHGIPRSGRLMIIDPSKGRRETDGVVQEVPFSKRTVEPIMKDRMVDGVWPQFTRPFPLSDKYFVVSAKLHSEALWGIYLVDIYDNVTLIAEQENAGYITPIPVVKRAVPPVIPDRVIDGEREATVFIQDIYEGEGLRGVPRGTVKKFRVFAYEYAYQKSTSDFDALGVQSGWDLKRELGTVAVEEDGSAMFIVPANTPISLQPLDDKGNAIQWMRSWFTAMPGETLSCVGCHEDQNTIPIPKRVIAANKKPSELDTPKGGVRPFSYELEIQPILDRNCVSCHNDQSTVTFDLSGKHKKQYVRWSIYASHRYMNMSYYNIHPYVYRQGPEADLYVLRPYEYHGSNSELIQMLEKGHKGVKLSEDDINRLYHWVDFNAPYFGSFEISGRYKQVFEQYPRRIQLMKKYANVSTDWKKELQDYAQFLAEESATKSAKTSTVESTKSSESRIRMTASTPSSVNKWAFDAQKAKAMQSVKGQTRKEIEVAPRVKMTFVWIPQGKFYVGEDRGSLYPENYKDVEIKRGFWMSETEVTNEQYCALVPEHDSRFIGEQWKDHTTPGLAANKPEQPVIRVSWREAMEYGKKISAKTGLNVTLPTEHQWEWACRAGSADDMWYGNRREDYSSKENMADTTIRLLAVYGLEPTVPMPGNFPSREFWDYVPRDNFANDGQNVPKGCGQYETNAWGLYDMHGNVAEWTRSECTDIDNFRGDKIVRGGSWRDRASKSTAFFRRYFKDFQAPYNVGIRLIIEE